ncbi:hypothetical protein AVEN_170354-1 [Araneus ventricosus]|uniref:Transposase Tc1-like domain-containing protein n=1 Tax=Araneus ventricosus TaxID=182803 RepID=A0A4Y2CBR7_ARAVE|nr:hypothetical protein AVEN_170354-1 [Araneus ventricosus]
MARRLGTSITETARLVGCSRFAVVRIHAKWISDGDTSSRRQVVGRPRVIKEKGRRRLSRLVKQNRGQTVVQLTAQYNADPNASVSEHTVQRTLLDMGLCSSRPTRVSLLTSVIVNYAYSGPGNIETGPWMSGRELPGRMNPDFSFITSMVVSGYGVCHSNSCSPLVQQVMHRLVVVLCFGDVLVGGSGTRSCGRTDHTHIYFVPGETELLTLTCTDTDEFHLMSWPPNSPDLNPMEYIWDVMETQLRAQTLPCPNISTLRDRCLDIWYNLSPVMYQKLVASMTRRVADVLKAKGGATRYWVGCHNVLAFQCIYDLLKRVKLVTVTLYFQNITIG